jgi:short-subunit dehydrogenase
MRERRAPIVVVTGASAGVGRATAVAFARRRCRLGLIARGRVGLDGARREVEAVGGEALVCPADVADAHALIEAADRIAERFGTIDVWVNNAMATVFGPFEDVTPAEFRRVTEVTYLGQVHGTMAALRHMRPRDAGTIVQVGSALAYRAIPLQSAYCGAKFAIRGFTDALRSELLHDRSRIRLTMVQLPAVNTPQFDWSRNHLGRRAQPVPPIFQPEAVAEAIVEAAERAPRELWVGGPAVKAIVGNMVVPALADRLLARQGYSGQITAEPLPPGRPDNLEAPIERDVGAHGRFGAQARTQVLTVEPAWLRGAAALGLAGLALGLGVLAWRRTAPPGVR